MRYNILLHFFVYCFDLLFKFCFIYQSTGTVFQDVCLQSFNFCFKILHLKLIHLILITKETFCSAFQMLRCFVDRTSWCFQELIDLTLFLCDLHDPGK